MTVTLDMLNAKAESYRDRLVAAFNPSGLVDRKGDDATIYIYDAIMPRGLGGISDKDVVAALRDAQGAKVLHVRINSPGGEVQASKAVYNAILGFSGQKVAHIDGLAASAASFIAMAADKIITAPEATWFIHNAQGVAMGDASAMRKAADYAERESTNIRSIYHKRTGQPEADLQAWMDAQTFMDAKEALARHFTDEIAGEEAVRMAAEADEPITRLAALVQHTAAVVEAEEAFRKAAPRVTAGRFEQVEALKRQQERTRTSASASAQAGRK
jgi:ATP-dependent Clp protease protease subunit